MKHATKDMAIEAKSVLVKQLFTPMPIWLKSVDVDYDDHGWYLTTKIKNKQEYYASNVKIPSVININGFNLKNCIMLLG